MAPFPPQSRDWALPSEADLTPHAAERVCREAAQKSFDEAARSLSRDWKADLAGKQVQRWAEAMGGALARRRDAQVRAYERGERPPAPANAVPLLVVGVDGGRWQGREKDEQTGSRWREQKTLTVSSYVPGDGLDPEQGGRKPQKLVTTHVATALPALPFGKLARVEAERRGLRQAGAVIGLGDGGNWIDPLFDREFRLDQRVVDWCHASEHLWDCAKALHRPDTPQAAMAGERLEALLWDGRVEAVVAALTAESARLGPPLETDGREHPRRVLANNVEYFTRHKEHMRYPQYRRKGWPIASGDTEAGVKQFNKRVKGTEQFWSEGGVEAVLTLRAMWISQDGRWDRHWDNRPAYVN